MTPLSQKRVAMGKKHSITQEIREEKLDDTPPEKKHDVNTRQSRNGEVFLNLHKPM